MSGLEGVASAAGLVSLSLTLFHGCIQAFQYLETAAHLGSDADIVRCKLEFEQYRLYQWAEQVGLEDRPSNRLNWTLASNILKQLEALLTSSQEWKARYALDVVELGKNALEREVAAKDPPRKTGFGLLLAKLKPNYTQASSRILQESNTSFKKLEWAAVGRDKLTKLVDDIGYFNRSLHSLLEATDRNFITAALGALLRDIISRSNVSSELDVVKELLQSTSVASPEAVASAASLKKIRLILGLGKSNGAQPPNTSTGVKLKLTYLKPRHLVRESMYNRPQGREVARYKSDLVLVEWRFFKRSAEPQLKSRVDQLAILLGNTHQPSFRSLHCLGILPKDPAYEPEDNAKICYGLVFELKVSLSATPVSSPLTILTLSDTYTRSRKPSLNERLAIALALTETVLQLHTTGWLHKGLRPDNVLFRQGGNQIWDAGTADGPYLAGFEYARPSAAETETAPGQLEWDLYRHPSAQGPARSNFNKSFDLFALGCILLEIALWTSLKEILLKHVLENGSVIDEKKHINHSEWNSIDTAKHDLLCSDSTEGNSANVAFYAGETFQEVISLCLHANNADPDDESLETQKLIVEKLKDCNF